MRKGAECSLGCFCDALQVRWRHAGPGGDWEVGGGGDGCDCFSRHGVYVGVTVGKVRVRIRVRMRVGMGMGMRTEYQDARVRNGGVSRFIIHS